MELEQHHRWSSLPDDILVNIISRLDLLRDTVITISPTNFSIEQNYKQYNKPTYNIYEYWTILDNLFTLFASPVIDTFCLDIQANHYDEPRCWPIIDRWARQLRSRNVRHMKLSCSAGFGQSDHQLGPPSVFQIHSLVTLELDFCANGLCWRLPNSILLPNLEKLCINKFNHVCSDEFDDYAYLGRLLSCCPSLEHLSLSIYGNCQESVVLITSKSLKRLHLNIHEKSISDVIIETPILEQLGYCSNSLLSMQMLNSISNVKSLKLSTFSSMRFINCLTTLPELTQLELSLSSEIYQAIFDQQMMHCPNLEVLVLDLFDYKEKIWNQDAVFMLVQQVKHIELYVDVYRVISKYVLNLVTWLLRSAPVLKKLVISGCGTRPSDDSLSKFHTTLLKCAEDTSRCQIEFLGGYKLE